MFDGLRRHWGIWREAMAAEAGRAASDRTADELAFLPAALEIRETPAPAAPRAVAAALIAFFVIAVLWASLGELDIHASAQGKLVAASGLQLIQPMETATVREIRVRDGDRVEADAVLVRLDDTRARVDAERLERELMEARTAAARLRALRQLADQPGLGVDSAYHPPENAPEELRSIHRHWLESRLAQHLAQRAALARETEEREAQLHQVRASLKGLSDAAPLLAEQLAKRRELERAGHAARLTVLEVERTVVERRGEQVSTTHRVEEVQAALKTLGKRREQAEQEFRSEVLGQLAEAERTAAAAKLELEKARQVIHLSTLRAPVAGVVQQLAVRTVGGVVTPAQPLMAIVPDGAALEAEAWLQNKDAGFVRQGQDAEIKVEAFPFTRYGTIRAKVKNVSRDTVQPQEVDKAKANDSGAQPPGPVFAVRLELEAGHIRTETGDTPLSAGMALTAEIKTGRRRVIDYVLAPLLRYRDESWRER